MGTDPGAEAIPLSGSTAVVTGAGSGIGRAICLALAQHGMDLVMVGRDAGRLAETARLAGGRSRLVVADIATAGGLQAAAALIPAQIRVLVHSAGQFRHGPILETSLEDWAALSAVNLHAPMVLTASCRSALFAGQGDVILINSTAGLRPGLGNGAYAATKHALRAAADTLRQELGAKGIRVISVFPGRTDTPMQQEVLAAEGRTAPAGALLQPSDLAEMIVAALRLPRRAEIPELILRPSQPC
jgi:short-subunit dehydrogenase